MMKRETLRSWRGVVNKLDRHPDRERERQLIDSHLEALDEIDRLKQGEQPVRIRELIEGYGPDACLDIALSDSGLLVCVKTEYDRDTGMVAYMRKGSPKTIAGYVNPPHIVSVERSKERW